MQKHQKWNAFDENGNEIPFRKITKDLWEVACDGAQEVTITYNYYANVLDAGSSYLDQNQLYVNPVNCCMYVIGRENEKYSLELDIPKDYQIACGIKDNNNTLLPIILMYWQNHPLLLQTVCNTSVTK